MIQTIRDLIAQHGRLPVDVASIADDQDLYAAGLTSFSAVQLMLGLEESFDVEFPDHMLTRNVFGSIATLRAALEELTGG